MRRAILTIQGLYQWDNTIFDTMAIPAGVDRDTLIGSIIMECSALEINIPNYDIFKTMLDIWSRGRLSNWERINSALQLEYEVIHNYDRTETHSETIRTDRAETWNDRENSTMNQSSGGSDTTTNRTAAFDGNRLTESGDTTTAYGGTANTTNTATQNGTQGVDETITRSNSVRAYGNIGITTNVQMLEEEMAFRQKYNIYDIITADFRNKFCILAY